MIEHNVHKEEKLSSIISDEFAKELPDTQTRWTKDGLLDIREEYDEEDDS